LIFKVIVLRLWSFWCRE